MTAFSVTGEIHKKPQAEQKHHARPISVMLLISSLEYGGAERQVVEMVRAFDRRRVMPLVCSLSDRVPLATGLPNPEDLVIVKRKGPLDFSAVTRVCRIVKERGIDILHAFLFDAEICSRLAGMLGRDVVVIASERNSEHRWSRFHAMLYHLTKGMFDGVIANSHAGKQFTIKEFGTSAERVDVVYNGVDTERFQSDRPSGAVFRAELGIEPTAPLVGMVASFKRQKRHEDFLRMAARVAEKLPDARFVVVGERLNANYNGSNDYHREILDLLESLPLKERCFFLGAREDIRSIYNACDVLVLPSSREGIPNVLLEAMACGTPVIATDISDNRKIVLDGETGFIVSLGDTEALAQRVLELLSNKELRESMGKSAREWVGKSFSFCVVAKKMEAVYRKYLDPQ